ncbi:phosphoribosyltransferase [Paraburkholderia oxyphila]|uniref:phosphoribosyltransferase n=1 Tax=Paraburkholderia oxyphila TaxID=614212 RepID=UPI0005B8E1DA|nr:phosphoribosyltransferase [Paraburkholderia oxyphila]
MNDVFQNRIEAGKQLGWALTSYAGRDDLVVLALPRGGVPVGYEVAKALRCPLDVLVVRKLGAPHNPELAMGAIASGDALYMNHRVLRALDVSEAQFAQTVARERVELDRRESAYRGERPPAAIEGKTVIVVDDGMATGATMHAALMALRARRPKHIVVATPVCPVGIETRFAQVVDDFVCVMQPDWFMGIGQFYADFRQTDDDEVRACLDAARDWQPQAAHGDDGDGRNTRAAPSGGGQA